MQLVVGKCMLLQVGLSNVGQVDVCGKPFPVSVNEIPFVMDGKARLFSYHFELSPR